MFTYFTFSDWMKAADKTAFIEKVITAYRASSDFLTALEGLRYATGRNTGIAGKMLLKPRVSRVTDERGKTVRTLGEMRIKGNQIANGFFRKATLQQNQHLLGNGVTLESAEQKAKLGAAFDTTLSRIGWYALLQGVCWGFYNVDHIEAVEAAKDACSGFCALLDDVAGVPRLGVQFWKVSDKKPMNVRLFEEDGFTILTENEKHKLAIVEEKKSYIQTVARDALGETVIGGENYNALPVIPFYANAEKTSELTLSIKSKIDAYDNILSDFGDNLDRANDVYWVLNNFGGSTPEVLAMLEEIDKIKAVINRNDGTGSATAEPKTIEVPYAARQTALQILRKEMYSDYMALDMDALTGGSLTNVAIEAATADLNLKADMYEWQAFDFVQRVLRLLNIETENISFRRQTISNKSETVADIYAMRSDIDRRTALKKNPYIMDDEIEEILNNMDAEDVSGLSGMDVLRTVVDE